MKAENVVLAAIGVLLLLGLYASYEAITSVVTYFTYDAPSLITKLGIAISIPAVYLLVFGHGVNLGTVTGDGR